VKLQNKFMDNVRSKNVQSNHAGFLLYIMI
jgi:hypothetical protein